MKLFIKNRKGEKISILIEGENNSGGLAFVMHGLSGNKNESHLRKIIKSFLDNNITAVSFDTTNTFGESEGNYENATVTNYYDDLEDVVTWAKSQNFYNEPFYLTGHSLGGICTSLFAQNHSNEVKALAPISTVVSGELSVQLGNRDMDEWKKIGYVIEESSTSPTGFKKLKYSHIEDRLKYNLLENVEKLSMPVLMIVGDEDTSTPLKHQKILFEKILGEKEFHIIKGAPHTFKKETHLNEIYDIFDKWIKKTT